jgi:hypothetical protein
LQRFLSEDLIGLSGGDANLYAYVSSSPLAHTDRSGEVAPEVAACVGGALFNLVTERLSGRKFTTSDAISGCAAGLAGVGLGKVLGGLQGNLSRLPRIRTLLTDETGSINPAVRRFTPDQDALIQLAKDARRRGGLTEDEGSILKAWADEYGVLGRGPEAHPGRGYGS